MMSNLAIDREKLKDAVDELKSSMRYCTEVSVIAGEFDGVVFRLVANKSDDEDVFRDDEEAESRFMFLSKQQYPPPLPQTRGTQQ